MTPSSNTRSYILLGAYHRLFVYSFSDHFFNCYWLQIKLYASKFTGVSESVLYHITHLQTVSRNPPSPTYFPAPDRPRDTPRCAYISRVSGHGRLHCTREARVDTAASNGLALFLLSAARNTTVSLSVPAHTPAAR